MKQSKALLAATMTVAGLTAAGTATAQVYPPATIVNNFPIVIVPAPVVTPPVVTAVPTPAPATTAPTPATAPVTTAPVTTAAPTAPVTTVVVPPTTRPAKATVRLTVTFSSSSTTLTANMRRTLQQFAATVRQEDLHTIVITGYAGSGRSAATRARLAQQRAAAIRSYLAGQFNGYSVRITTQASASTTQGSAVIATATA